MKWEDDIKHQIIDEYTSCDISITSLSKKYSVSQFRIGRLFKSSNIKIRRGKLEHVEQEIIAEYQSGLSTIKLGEKYDCNPVSIWELLKKHDIKLRSNSDYKGKHEKRSKLEQDAEEIIYLYTIEKKTADELGIIFDCAGNSIRYLLEMNDIEIRSRDTSSRKYTVDYDFFEEIDTEEKAYVLGLLYADGCVDLKCTRVLLGLIDQQLVEDVKNIMSYDGPVTRTEKYFEGVRVKDEYLIQLSSRKLCEDLIKHGCVPRKTFKITYPTTVPENLQRHFIRGYFDGDGSVWCSEKLLNLGISICGTERFCKSIRQLLKDKLGINCRLRKRENIFELTIGGNLQIEKFAKYIWQDSSIFLKRKRKKYSETVAKINMRKTKAHLDFI